MLFHITQKHPPNLCPINEGGPSTLFNPSVEGLTLHMALFSYAEHTNFYVVEADAMETVHRFLRPGFTRCEHHITAVSRSTDFR